MEVRIDINGDLIVDAMSETEAYVLTKWKVFFDDGISALKLVIKPSGATWDAENNVIVVS